MKVISRRWNLRTRRHTLSLPATPKGSNSLMNDNIFCGIDIGGTKTAVVISAEPPAVLGRKEFATLPAKGPEGAIKLAKEAIRELLTGQGCATSAIKRIGVSCGGPLDRIRGSSSRRPICPPGITFPSRQSWRKSLACRARWRMTRTPGQWRSIDSARGREREYGVPDHGHRPRRGHHHGWPPLSRHERSGGRSGSHPTDAQGPVGHNKAGSAEGWASGGGMAQLATQAVAAAAKKKQRTVLAAIVQSGKALSARDVGMAAQQGDRVALGILESTGRRLGEVLRDSR